MCYYLLVKYVINSGIIFDLQQLTSVICCFSSGMLTTSCRCGVAGVSVTSTTCARCVSAVTTRSRRPRPRSVPTPGDSDLPWSRATSRLSSRSNPSGSGYARVFGSAVTWVTSRLSSGSNPSNIGHARRLRSVVKSGDITAFFQKQS